MSTSAKKNVSWIMKVPVISSSHLTEKTLAIKTDRNFNGPGGFYTVQFSHGFMLFNSEPVDDDLEIPDDLRDCLEWAYSNDFEWIRFDPDGDIVKGLKVYDFK
jgi:hypothetical protein